MTGFTPEKGSTQQLYNVLVSNKLLICDPNWISSYFHCYGHNYCHSPGTFLPNHIYFLSSARKLNALPDCLLLITSYWKDQLWTEQLKLATFMLPENTWCQNLIYICIQIQFVTLLSVMSFLNFIHTYLLHSCVHWCHTLGYHHQPQSCCNHREWCYIWLLCKVSHAD